MKENTSVRLKRIMEERGLKQVNILKLCEPYCEKYNVKLDKNYLSQYVSGKVEPGQHTLSILGMALNLNEAWLMGYDVPRERNSMPQSDDNTIENTDISKISGMMTLFNEDGREIEKIKFNDIAIE